MPELVISHLRGLAATLREQLDQAERLIVQVDGENVATLLTLLDQIDQMFADLAESGLDLRTEQTRWDSLLARLHNHPQKVVQAAHVAGGMSKLRAEHATDDNFWWHLDEDLTRRRVKAVRRFVVTAVIIGVAVVGGLWAINHFFPPNPEAVAMVETTNSIGSLIAADDWEQALTVVQEARNRFPNQPELAVWEVVILEHLGQTEQAAATLETARQLLADTPAQLWVYLGNDRMMAGDLAGAEDAAKKGLAIAPNEPQLVFLLGGIAEARGDVSSAINYFDQTFELAQNTQPQLAVIARVRMGQLMQSSNTFMSPAATPAQ